MTEPAIQDRSIGRLIAEANKLSADQVEAILQHQRAKGIRFGEAAVELGFASGDEVLWALSQQFHYPYAPGGAERLGAELVMAKQPFSVQAEAFRSLRSEITLHLLAPDQPRRAIAVVSADRGDGRSFFAANLAIALSQLGGRTLLVDADLRAPRLHEIFQVANGAGLSGILAGRAEMNVIQAVPELPSLFVMPAGAVPPNPTELIERPAFGLMMQELGGKFDHVLVDTSAASEGSESVIAAARCGAALVVARRHRSTMSGVRELLHRFRATECRIAGLVMNEH